MTVGSAEIEFVLRAAARIVLRDEAPRPFVPSRKILRFRRILILIYTSSVGTRHFCDDTRRSLANLRREIQIRK